MPNSQELLEGLLSELDYSEEDAGAWCFVPWFKHVELPLKKQCPYCKINFSVNGWAKDREGGKVCLNCSRYFDLFVKEPWTNGFN